MIAISSWPKSRPKAMCSWTGTAAELLWSSIASDPSTLSQAEAKYEMGRSFFLVHSSVHPYLPQSQTLLMFHHPNKHTNRPGDSHQHILLGPPMHQRQKQHRANMSRS